MNVIQATLCVNAMWHAAYRKKGNSERHRKRCCNPVFLVGARTGRDGIHASLFASVELSENQLRTARPSRSATRSLRIAC